ncbi:integumentary mucin C.1-like [Aphis gossypii]|uniref:integumentary mucin C.1-like n=1 Tax=Aphis gossypii TaxID=80765 RepID=UPI00100F035E|nr:integumentary mucin C.1-like [Aphis gossypii]XP_050062948.1 integumentary mucin C.1-like [Aphis gossypii]
MNYLKAVLMLWTYNIAFITSENTTVVRGSINAWDSKQTYCGELLTRSIEILCVEMRIKRPRPRRPRDIVEQAVGRRHRNHLFFQKNCCDSPCNLNFIKAHCPVKRKRHNKKNENKKNPSVSPVNRTQKPIITRTNTTALPFDMLLRHKIKNATVSTSATTTTSTSTTPISTIPTTTTPISTTPIRTTSTSTTTTTTTTTEDPSYVDYAFFLGFPP